MLQVGVDNIREYFKQNADMLEGRRKRKFSLLKQVCIVMHACMQSHLRPHSPQRCSDTYFGHAESLMRMWLQYSSACAVERHGARSHPPCCCHLCLSTSCIGLEDLQSNSARRSAPSKCLDHAWQMHWTLPHVYFNDCISRSGHTSEEWHAGEQGECSAEPGEAARGGSSSAGGGDHPAEAARLAANAGAETKLRPLLG